MKNAIIIMAALCISPLIASANIEKIEFGGYINFEAGFTKQSKSYASKSRQEATSKFLTKSIFSIDTEGKTDNGIKYGAAIKIKASEIHDHLNEDSPDDVDEYLGDTTEITQSYVYAAGKYGLIKAGMIQGGSKLKSQKFGNLGGTGGAIGDWSKFISTSIAGAPKPDPLDFLDDLDLDDLTDDELDELIDFLDDYIDFLESYEEEDLYDPVNSENRISYITPRILKALHFLVEFTPHAKSGGTSSSFSNRRATAVGTSRNIIKIGLIFTNKLGPVNITLSANNTFGRSIGKKVNGSNLAIHNLKTYDGTIKLNYKEFTLAYAYNNRGKSLQLAKLNVADAVRQVASVSYNKDEWNVALSYLYNKSIGSNIAASSLAIDYKLADGFVPYIEGTLFKIAPSKGIKQQGNVIIIGTKFVF
jgi:hypothetical protein